VKEANDLCKKKLEDAKRAFELEMESRKGDAEMERYEKIPRKF
jgi:hypothetical protein